jgi:hypothetical protein
MRQPVLAVGTHGFVFDSDRIEIVEREVTLDQRCGRVAEQDLSRLGRALQARSERGGEAGRRVVHPQVVADPPDDDGTGIGARAHLDRISQLITSRESGGEQVGWQDRRDCPVCTGGGRLSRGSVRQISADTIEMPRGPDKESRRRSFSSPR